MLKYQKVLELDDELYQFHLRQKGYYMLQEIVPTKEYLINDMVIPDGFDEIDHFIYKVYFKNEMVGLIDYQLGYRFSMIHDDKCIWIGLFLVDESYQRKGFGKEILNKVVKKYGDFYNRIQLASIRDNFKGLVFWKKMGFKEIATSSYCNLEVIIFEKKI